MKLFKYIRERWGNQRVLYVWFVLVLMAPSFFLFYTEPMTAFARVAFLAFPLAFYLLLLVIPRRPGVMIWLLFPLLVLGAFQLVVLNLFGQSIIASDMFLNLFTTNSSEAFELLDKLLPAVAGVCILYIPTLVLGVWSIRSLPPLDPRFRRVAAKTGGGLLLAAGLFIGLSYGQSASYSIWQDIYPANIFYNIRFAWDSAVRSRHYPEAVRDFRFGAVSKRPEGQREIYVLVVGETARAKNWGLYGYGRDTSPLLGQEPGLIAYTDAVTQCNATHKSVPLILSAASAEDFESIYRQKSIVTAFKEAGFKTVFLSNHRPNRSFIDYFAEESDFYYNLKVESDAPQANPHDMELVGQLRHLLQQPWNKLFVVLHCYGSHFNYQERYPDSLAVYRPDRIPDISVRYRTELVNAYDNTIRYTDALLHRIVSELSARPDALSAMIYLSDHGEDIIDDGRERFLHASPVPTYYQLHIPLLLWLSPAYEAGFPEQVRAAREHRTTPVTSQVVFHTLLDLAAVDAPCFDPAKSLVNDRLTAGRRAYLNDHNRPWYLDQIPFKSEDRAAFRAAGIEPE